MGDSETAVADAVEQPAAEPGGETSVEQPQAETTEQVIMPEHEVREEGGEETKLEGGKLTADRVKNGLKALRESDPELAEALRKAYYSDGDWRTTFPSLREAKVAKLAWDSVGGETGFADLREKEQEIKWVNEAAERGDVAIIDDWVKDFPDGYRQVMPYAVKKWAQLDGEAFSKAIAPHFSSFLERSQLSDRLSEAFDAIGAGNGQGAQSLLRNIYAWVNAQRQNAPQSGSEAANPAEEKLTQRENDLRQKEDRMFRGEIGRETFKYQQDQVQRALAPYLKTSKLSEQAKIRLVTSINHDIEQALEKNQGFQRQMTAWLAKKDSRGTIDYLKGQLDLIIPSISKRVVQDLYGLAPKPAKPASISSDNGNIRQNAAPAGPIKLNRKPAMSDIQKSGDWMASYIGGRATMAKGQFKGKIVTWSK